MSELLEAADAAFVAIHDYHCAACAVEALTGDERAGEVIGRAASFAVHVDPRRLDATAMAFAFGVLTGRALMLRAGVEREGQR